MVTFNYHDSRKTSKRSCSPLLSFRSSKTKLESMKLIVSFTGIKFSFNFLARVELVKTSFSIMAQVVQKRILAKTKMGLSEFIARASSYLYHLTSAVNKGGKLLHTS